MLCSVMQAQVVRNISLGFVPYGNSKAEESEYTINESKVHYGFTIDYERRFIDKSGNGMFTNSGALTVSVSFLSLDNVTKHKATVGSVDNFRDTIYAIDETTKNAFSISVGMEWILNPKSRVQFPIGMELLLGSDTQYTLGFAGTAKMRFYITDNLGIFAGIRVPRISGIFKLYIPSYYLNCGLVYTLGN